VLRQKNGSRVDVEVNAGIIHYEGKPADFVLVKNINRTQAGGGIAAGERTATTVPFSTNTGTSMILIEEDMTISMANREFARNSGYSIDEIKWPMKWTEIVHPDDLRRMVEQPVETRGQGSALPGYELRYITKTGDLRDALLSIQLYRHEEKRCFFIDITTVSRLEKKLMNSEENSARWPNPALLPSWCTRRLLDLCESCGCGNFRVHGRGALQHALLDFVHPDHKNMENK